MNAPGKSRTTAAAVVFAALIVVVVGFQILQPALGLGVAASRAASPAAARLKSIATHLVFGLGLYWTSLLLETLS